MKTLTIIIFIFILSGPVFAWDDCADKWNEDVRQAEEENYRNRMLAIQEDLLFLEQQEHDLRMREYWEGQND